MKARNFDMQDATSVNTQEAVTYTDLMAKEYQCSYFASILYTHNDFTPCSTWLLEKQTVSLASQDILCLLWYLEELLTKNYP
jgi:hypothetical protein